MKDTITGWKELEAFTGLKSSVVKRKIAYYGFPRPLLATLPISGKATHVYIWSRLEVEAWRERKECWTKPLLPEVGSSLRFRWGRGGDSCGQEKSKS